MVVSPERFSKLAALVALAALLWPAAAAAQDDDVVFTAYVEPNVLFFLDNSESMKWIVRHPDFDPDLVSTCTIFAPDELFYIPVDTFVPALPPCVARTIYADPDLGADTIYQGQYLNWILSNEASSAYLLDISSDTSGTASSCLGGGEYAKYKLSKLSSAKRAIPETICEVNLTSKIRVGAATFREPDPSTNDPNGGYIIEDIDAYTDKHAQNINDAFDSIKAGTWSPLAESLFQIYTYFMSRDVADRPIGRGPGHTKHAHPYTGYYYTTSSDGVGGEAGASAATIAPSPMEVYCQRNFVIMLTAGEPTRDDFKPAVPESTAVHFKVFHKMIGDWVDDGEVEFQTDKYCEGCQTAMFLDDVAYFMAVNDFNTKLEGNQLVDTYIISMSDDDDANDLLRRTAALGNGTFTLAGNPEEISNALVGAFKSLVAKAQTFNSASVPASRTSDGGKIYVSQFQPTDVSPYWVGHLKSFQISSGGEILDKNGDCALDDPIAGQCFGGPIKPSAQPDWDAFDAIPSPAARNLWVSSLAGGSPGKVPFDNTLTATDLGVVFPPAEVYLNSVATDANDLKDEIVDNVRGCEFGVFLIKKDDKKGSTTLSSGCVPREAIQSDIFHSNPVVVGRPAAYDPDPSYGQFAVNYAQRDRVILAGSNGGFLQGFLAGEWDSTLTPPGYDAGTGVEIFGFMPWPARQKIRFKPIDTGARDYYFVDGSPTVSDVWLYTNATTAPKLASGIEWKTVVVGGLREGGEAYYALDITDPSDADYPKYMWEFPSEDAPASLKQYIGNTWSDPVLTRIKVAVNGNTNSGEGFERWVMIVAGGYDPSGDPNNVAAYDPTATKGRGIFMVDVKTGEVLAQQVFTPGALAGDPRRDMRYAIPSSPGVFDLDFDGFADVIYVGDLGGNLWKWVIHPVGTDPVNGAGSPDDQPNWTFRRLFAGPIGSPPGGVFDHYKSFFFPPLATYKGGQLWLAFASGERANLVFEGVRAANKKLLKGPEDNNRFYALKDLDPLEQLAIPQTQADESVMLSLDQTTPDICGDPSAYRGYYYIAREAEKFIVNLDLFLGYVFVGSYIPTDSVEACGVRGKSFLSIFRIECGEGFFRDAGGDPRKTISLGAGLPSDPRVTIDSRDGGDSGNRVIIGGQDGAISSIEAPPGFSTFGMFYWRELHQ